MKVVLLGATGKVGAPIRDELLGRGHEVVAVVRNVDRLPQGVAGLEPRQGDVFDGDFLAEVLAGADVVLVSVAMRDDAQRGVGGRSPVDLVRIASDAALAAGVRFFTMGGAGSLEVAPGRLFVDTPEFPDVAKPESEGFRDALIYLREEAPAELDWTMASPPAIIDPEGEKTGAYRTGRDALIRNGRGQSRISAADLAVAVVDELEEPLHRRMRFAIGE